MLIIGFDIGIKNFAYCILEKNAINTRDSARFTAPTKILALENIDLQCRKNETQKIIDRTIDLLDDILNQIETSEKIHVLIESQMTSAMKSIQTVINTFFKMQKKYQSLDIETKYLSAKHKLNLIEKYSNSQAHTHTHAYIPNAVLANTSYRQNKIDSVHFAKWLLGNKENKYYNEEILNKLCKAKKQDDLADALLMSIYFAES
jgi:hypothetical protein